VVCLCATLFSPANPIRIVLELNSSFCSEKKSVHALPQSAVFTDRYSTVTDCRQDVLCSVPGRPAVTAIGTVYTGSYPVTLTSYPLRVQVSGGCCYLLTSVRVVLQYVRPFFAFPTSRLVWRFLSDGHVRQQLKKTLIRTKACDPSTIVSWLPLY